MIEVLSVGNTYSEMSRKRREYFHAGVELLWMVDPRERTITVYRSSQEAVVYTEAQRVEGGKVLPGWEVDAAKLFGKLDQHA